MKEKKQRRQRGQVEPLGGGKFRVRVPLRERGPKGRARTYSEMLYDTTPEKADDRRGDLVTLMRTGKFFNPAPLTVKAVTEEWMNQQKRKGLALTTIANYQDTLNSCVLPYVGRLQLKDFQPGALEGMFNALQDRGLSDSTIKHTRAVCKFFIRYAVWKKYLKENQLDGLELPKGAEPRETHSLTPAEARTLIETALLDLDDLIFVFALYTGMRPKEYLGLPLSNIERMDDRTARVRVTQQVVKLRRAAGHVFTKPKTKAGLREVFIPAWLFKELMRLNCANEARASVVGAEWSDHGLVFSSRTGRPISEDWLRQMFARLLKRAGLPAHFSPYSLRHTHNTILYIAGVPDKTRCLLMGHVCKDFNSRVYVQPLPEMFEGVVEKLETLIFGVARPSLAPDFAPSEAGRVM